MTNEKVPTGAPQPEEVPDPEKNLAAWLEYEKRRLEKLEIKKLSDDQKAVSQMSQEVAEREEAELKAAERMADDPQRAKSAAELMENIKDPKIRRPLIILSQYTPGTVPYEQALDDVPEQLNEVADHVMPATQSSGGEEERKLCDWILFRHFSLSEGKTGVDLGLISDEFFQERMNASRALAEIRLTSYDSQEEFNRKFSDKTRNIRIERALAELRRSHR